MITETLPPAANDVVEMARNALTLTQRAERAIADRDAKKADETRDWIAGRRVEVENDLRAELKRLFGLEEIPSNAVTFTDGGREPYVMIAVDGLTFAISESQEADWRSLSIVRKCSDCGGAVYNQARSFEELGDALTKRPVHWSCREEKADPQPEPARSLDEKLIEAIRYVVRDELANQGVGL